MCVGSIGDVPQAMVIFLADLAVHVSQREASNGMDIVKMSEAIAGCLYATMTPKPASSNFEEDLQMFVYLIIEYWRANAH